MRHIKLFGIELALALFLGLGSAYAYIYEFSLFEHLNSKVIDAFFMYRGALKTDDRIVIIDIDEKSLHVLGQWPWSRDKVAQMLENLNHAGVGVIGLDIVFAEEDSSSPHHILKEYGCAVKEVKNHDTILAKTLGETPTIAGYLFNFEANTTAGMTPNISTIIIEKNKNTQEFIPQAQGLVANIERLQENTYSSGFFNTIPDKDGIVRSIPLVINYNNTLFPSLSLEIMRLIQDAKKIVLHYTDVGISSIEIGNIFIPTDRFGQLRINYMGKAKHYTYISAADIYNNHFKPEAIEGKIALIGTSAGGLVDLRATPMDSTYPGVEIHATALDNMLNHSFISNPSWVEAADILGTIVIALFTVLLFTFFGAFKTALFFVVALGGFVYFAYMLFIHQGIVLNVVYPLNLAVILYMSLASLRYVLESKQKELIKSKFMKKVSHAVAEDLMKQGSTDILQAKEREISIFFSDIRGFTSISESFNNPTKLIEFLNLYMNPMTEIITNNQGTVDKFIGDAIMAYWNAPNTVENHADKALQSAITQIQKLKELNSELEANNLPSIAIGIGINTGLAVVGEMGSIGRSDYTIIGDSVNVASRIEGLCKTYNAQIIISEYTKEKLKDTYTLRYLDDVKVKGKAESVKIYEVIV